MNQSEGNEVRWASEIRVPVVVPMAKVMTIVSMEAGETRCSVENSSTRSGSFETTNNFKLIVFDRNTLALIFFLALFLLIITLVRNFNFVLHRKLIKIFFRLVSYYSILSALRWRHFTQKVGESLCITHFLVSSTAKPKEAWLMGEKCVQSCSVVVVNFKTLFQIYWFNKGWLSLKPKSSFCNTTLGAN